jgi:hypothetical protein
MADTNGSDTALETAKHETRAAFENRAQMYYYIFDELSEELGAEKAAEVMRRAIRRRGVEVGRKYGPAAETRDLAEVGRIFCEGSACEGELFHPGIEEQNDEGIVLSMTSCPLVDAWRALGLPAEKIDTLCGISAAVDEGTFEGAGLELTFGDRLGKPGSCRCLLELRLPPEEG